MRAPLLMPLVFGLLATGCDACGADVGLAASGARDYVRCLAADPPSPRSFTRGGLRFELEGRELRVEAPAGPLRMAAFGGAGFELPPESRGALDTVAKSGAQLVLVLGGMGDTPELAKAFADRLQALGPAVLFVAGGRDGRGRYLPALSGLDAIVDASTLDRIRIGEDTFVPLAGSADGRYTLDSDSCGFGLDDLKERAGRLGEPEPGERRWLLSVEAPAGPLSRAAVEVGNADLAELAKRVGARGGLHGWPELHVGQPHAGGQPIEQGVAARDFSLVVPRVSGPWQLAAGGTRSAPGAVHLELDGAGMKLTLK